MSINIFICHASYEPRCLSYASSLGSEEFTDAVIIATNQSESDPVYRGHFDEFITIFEQAIKKTPRKLVLDREDNILFINQFDLLMQDYPHSSRITLDISTFPRDRLFLVLIYLSKKFIPKNVSLYHCSPEAYDTENLNDGWLAKGVKNVSAIPGFNGFQKSRAKCLIIVQLGHERERPHVLITELEPDKIVFIHQGKIQFKDAKLDLSYTKNISLLHSYGDKSLEEYSNDYNDWEKAKNIICEVYEKYHHSYNIFVSPTGTKLQAIGAFAAVLKYPGIQIRYARPQFYNPSSSFGIGNEWIGNLGEITR